MSIIETVEGANTFISDLHQFQQARARLAQIFKDLDSLEGDPNSGSPEHEAELSVFITICNQDAILLRSQAEALGLLGKALLLSISEVVIFYPEQGIAEPWQDIEFWPVVSPDLRRVNHSN